MSAQTDTLAPSPFSEYAFVGWVWTIAVHDHEVLPPGTRSASGCVCPPEFAALGDTPLGWRFDAALRSGWGMLGDDARAFAAINLLPVCPTWLKDMLTGKLTTR